MAELQPCASPQRATTPGVKPNATVKAIQVWRRAGLLLGSLEIKIMVYGNIFFFAFWGVGQIFILVLFRNAGSAANNTLIPFRRNI